MYIYGNPRWGSIYGDINDQTDLMDLLDSLGSGGHGIQDEGTPLAQRANLNFVGAGVTVTDDAGNDATIVTINGGGGGGTWGTITGTLSDQTDLQDALDAKSDVGHGHVASDITDFDTEVSNNSDVAANTAARHNPVTVTDSSEVDFTLVGQDITAVLKTTGVSAATYGSATASAVVQLDSKGRALSASNTNISHSTNSGAISAAGSTISDATALTSTSLPSLFRISSCTLGQGVKLPAGSLTRGAVRIINDTSAPCNVYPPTASDTINDLATGVPYVHPAKSTIIYESIDSDEWFTPNNLPLLANNNVWLGDANSVPQPVNFDTEVSANTDVAASKVKTDFLTVTQPVDLDAIEARVNSLDAAVVLRGSWDASAGTFPGGGTAQAGDSYIVSVGGTVNSIVFTANDRIVAILDNASTTTYAANWLKLDYTDQVLSVAGKTGAVTLVSTDITDFTEATQDATGAMVDATLVYDDATPRLKRAPITGDISIPDGSNTAAIGAGVIVNADVNAAAAIDATKIHDGTISNTEFGHLNGVSSNIQTQIDSKVTGPASATDNAIVRYDGTTGKLVQDTDVTIDDTTHAISRGTTNANLLLRGNGTGEVRCGDASNYWSAQADGDMRLQGTAQFRVPNNTAAFVSDSVPAAGNFFVTTFGGTYEWRDASAVAVTQIPINGCSVFKYGIAYPEITHPQLTANTNNLAPGSDTGLLILTTDGTAWNVTGFVAPTNGSSRRMWIYNNNAIGGTNINITHQDAASTVTNRVKTLTGAAVAIAPQQMALLQYFDSLNRHVLFT